MSESDSETEFDYIQNKKPKLEGSDQQIQTGSKVGYYVQKRKHNELCLKQIFDTSLDIETRKEKLNEFIESTGK